VVEDDEVVLEPAVSALAEPGIGVLPENAADPLVGQVDRVVVNVAVVAPDP
jgi:hypothetical protein